jgi:hypothetical protein
VRTILTGVDPPAPGLTVQVVVSVSAQVVVENTTGELLEILDDAGKPFIRIGPGGVEGDFGSATWAAVNTPEGLTEGLTLEPGPERWVTVTTAPSWGWFDHRMHPTGAIAGPWEIPMRLGGRPLAIKGRVEPLAYQGAFVPVLRSEPRPVDGLVVTVLPGRVPGVYVESQREDTVTVFGSDGMPFARISPNGVEVNPASSTWQADRKAQGHVLDVIGRTDWYSIDTRPVLAWLDERGLFPELDPPARVRGATEPVDVIAWDVPIEVGGRRIVMKAVTQWVPFAAPEVAGGQGDSSSSFPVAPAITIGAGVALLAAWAIRRSRPSSR